jgi:hypothetical protein
MDLRAAARNGQPLSAQESPKGVFMMPGDVITLDLYAQIRGTNGLNDETFLSAYGSVISTGALLGTLAGGVVAPFNSTGFQNGAQVDLDLDGDLDVGAPANSTGAAVSSFFLARSLFATPGTTVIDANTSEIRIGTFTFTVTGGGPETLINFVRRTDAVGGNLAGAASWFEDGAPKSPTSSTYAVGSPVQAIIPEPGSTTAAAIALGLALFGRRRRCA